MKASTKITIVSALFMWAGVFIIFKVDSLLVLGVLLYYIGDQMGDTDNE